jgi:hypothetical protein
MNTEHSSSQPSLVSLADTTAPNQTPPAQGHIQDLSVSVKGLIKRLEYKYEIEGLGANWPLAIVPISGTFVASSRIADIKAKAVFCPNFTLCPSGSPDVLDYNPHYSYGIDKTKNLLFSTVRAKVSEVNSNSDFLYSEPITLSCSNCLPQVGPRVILPDTMVLDSDTKNAITLSGVASGISPDIRYSYVFKVLDSTWPVNLYPISGTAQSNTNELKLFTQLVFCKTSGLYDSGMCNDSDKRATVSLELLPLSDSFETVSILSVGDTEKLVSNNSLIRCNNCLPSNPKITLPDTLTLNSTTKNTVSITGTISGISPYTRYSYIFKTLDTTWPIELYPISGTAYTNGDECKVSTQLVFCKNSGSYDSDACGTTKSKRATINLEVSSLNNAIKLISNDSLVLCDNCISYPKITLPDNILLDNKTQNSITISGMASGISPDTRYSYHYKVLDATWPVSLYPLSGTVKSATEVVSISSQLVFCETSGNYQTDMCGTPKEKRATLSLELTPLTANTDTVSILSIEDTKIVSNDTIATCDDCIPYPKLTLSASLLNTNKSNRITINGLIKNLKANHLYNYSLENVDSNWPLYVGSRSGTITPASSEDISLSFIGEFCKAVSLCPSGSSAVIPYSTVVSHTNAYTSSSFKLKLVDPAITGSYYSNNIRVYCSDCSQSFMPVVVSSQVSDNPTC